MPPDPDAARPIELLEASLRRTRWSLALAVLLLLGYAAAVASVVSFARFGARKKGDELLTAVRQQLVKDVGPLTGEAADMAASVTPPVASAFFDQVRQDLPALTRTAEKQAKKLADHLEATLQKDLEARYKAERPKYREVLKQEFPEITDRATIERMVDQFEAAFNKLIRRYHVKEYRTAVERTAKQWQEIAPASAPGGPKALAQQFSDDLTEWLQVKVLESEAGLAGKEEGK